VADDGKRSLEMKQNKVQIGHIYATKLDGRVVPVQILYGVQKPGASVLWMGTNLETGGSVGISKAARLRYELEWDGSGGFRRLTK